MITAKEMAEEYISNSYESKRRVDKEVGHIALDSLNLANLLREYARKVISEDRKSLINNIKLNHLCYDRDEDPKEFEENRDYWDCRYDNYGEPYAVSVYEVNKNSIIDAPQIELL